MSLGRRSARSHAGDEPTRKAGEPAQNRVRELGHRAQSRRRRITGHEVDAVVVARDRDLELTRLLGEIRVERCGRVLLLSRDRIEGLLGLRLDDGPPLTGVRIQHGVAPRLRRRCGVGGDGEHHDVAFGARSGGDGRLERVLLDPHLGGGDAEYLVRRHVAGLGADEAFEVAADRVVRRGQVGVPGVTKDGSSGGVVRAPVQRHPDESEEHTRRHAGQDQGLRPSGGLKDGRTVVVVTRRHHRVAGRGRRPDDEASAVADALVGGSLRGSTWFGHHGHVGLPGCSHAVSRWVGHSPAGDGTSHHLRFHRSRDRESKAQSPGDFRRWVEPPVSCRKARRPIAIHHRSTHPWSCRWTWVPSAWSS